MAKKAKSPTPTEARLGDLVLPQKEKVGKILTDFRRDVNPNEVSDLILGPFYEMVGWINVGRK